MITYKTTSVKTIVSKIYRDLNLQDETRYYDVYEWCGEALEHIGVGLPFMDAEADITVEDYKGLLPCNLFMVDLVTINDTPILPTTGFKPALDCKVTYGLDSKYIHVPLRETTIHMYYKAFPTDDEGLPLVPDDVSYREALYRYSIMKFYYPQYLNNKISERAFRDMETKWEDYCAQAGNKALMPDIGQLENLKNNWIRLIPNINEFKTLFNGLNDSERLTM